MRNWRSSLVQVIIVPQTGRQAGRGLPNGVVVMYLRLVHLQLSGNNKDAGTEPTTCQRLQHQLACVARGRTWRLRWWIATLASFVISTDCRKNSEAIRIAFAIELVRLLGLPVNLTQREDPTVLKLKTTATTTGIHSTDNMGVRIGLYRKGRVLPCSRLSATRSDALDFRNYPLDFGWTWGLLVTALHLFL